MIAVIAGATGLTGSELLRRLLHEPRITRVLTIVRSPGQIPKNEKIEEILLPPGGFSELLLKDDPRISGELFFCALGTTIKKAGSQEEFRKVDFDAVVAFAKLAESKKARCFALVSATGASAKSQIFYSRVKGEAEQALQKLTIPRVIIARPSLLIGQRQEVRRAERLGIRLFGALAPVLPQTIRSRLGTPVSSLAKRLIDEALSDGASSVILESQNLDA